MEGIRMYIADENRYDRMIYRRCGKSGLRLPAVSLGFQQNFGNNGCSANMENMVHTAFDLGITHFDLANNYGNPYNASRLRISWGSSVSCIHLLF